MTSPFFAANATNGDLTKLSSALFNADSTKVNVSDTPHFTGELYNDGVVDNLPTKNEDNESKADQSHTVPAIGTTNDEPNFPVTLFEDADGKRMKLKEFYSKRAPTTSTTSDDLFESIGKIHRI